jgi:hypothetical protein
MRVDLLPMPYLHARELIEYCIERGIDLDNAERLLAAFTKSGHSITTDDWHLTVPESLMTYFAMKWA